MAIGFRGAHPILGIGVAAVVGVAAGISGPLPLYVGVPQAAGDQVGISGPLPLYVGVPQAAGDQVGISGPLPLWVGVPPAVVTPEPVTGGGGDRRAFLAERDKKLEDWLLKDQQIREDEEILLLVAAAVEADLI